MPKTVEEVALIAGAIALSVVTYGAASGSIAMAWGLTATASSTLFSIGVAAGISGVFGLLQPLLNPTDTSTPGSQQNAQNSVSYRRVIYGGGMEVGGVLTFDEMPAGGGPFQNVPDSEGNYGLANWRHQIYTIAGHQITSFGRGGQMAVVIDDIFTLLVQDSSGYWVPADPQNPYGGIISNPPFHIAFEFDTGDPASTSAFPLLTAACPDWKASQCIQRGRAKVHVAMRYDVNADGSMPNQNLWTSTPIYASGRVPTFRFPLQGKPVLDTRTNAPATNLSNPALCIYDWLTNSDYGLGVNPENIDIDAVNAAANICEELVTVYIGSNGGAVQEMLYTCNGMFDQEQARGDVLKAMVASMAGSVVPPGDLWRIFAGAYNPPVMTLTDDDLRASIKFDWRRSRRDIANIIKGRFLPAFLPTNNTEAQPTAWRWTDFPAYVADGNSHRVSYITEDGGQRIPKDITLAFTTSIWTAQRLAKICLMLLRFQVSGQLPLKLTAFPVEAGDTITFIHSRYAALSPPPPTTFFVAQANLTVDESQDVPTYGVDLMVAETDASIYEFTAPLSSSDQGEYSQYGSIGLL